jgi:molybdopterin/thiamine biosynthesis adenylyltransferase/predicted RNA-binding Zn-ribbon protein involved in translation (DUF1610 family)
MCVTQENFTAGETVAVIGLGNIGSQLVGHLARMREVGRIICCDPDTYSEANLTSQQIGSRDVGAAKAVATGRRLRDIRKDLAVTCIADRVENVAWGQLRAQVICGCVDSKAARCAINLIAKRLQIPYLDAGIRADGLLARVDVYAGNPEDSCLECAWGEKDYQSLGHIYSCAGELRELPATGASSALGGLAAAMQAMECTKLLTKTPGSAIAARQIVVESVCHHQYVNVLHRNPACRFEHERRPIAGARVATLGDVIRVGGEILGEGPQSIAVERKSWVTELTCHGCGEHSQILRLQGRIGGERSRCPHCGDQRLAVGFSMLPRLELSSLSSDLLQLSPECVGLQVGDVVTLRGHHSEHCIELNEPFKGK